MAVPIDTEKPSLKLPFTRIERANGLLLWLLVSFPISFVVFIASRFFASLHTLFTGLTLIYVIAVLVLIYEYFHFEERITIDATTVRYSRKSLFGSEEWSERLKNYTGVAVMTTDASKPPAASPTTPERSHWTKRPAPKSIRLVARDPGKTVTLWEFDARDFPTAVNKKLQNFAEMLDIEALSGQNA
jgi:hypothetical protein